MLFAPIPAPGHSTHGQCADKDDLCSLTSLGLPELPLYAHQQPQSQQSQCPYHGPSAPTTATAAAATAAAGSQAARPRAQQVLAQSASGSALPPPAKAPRLSTQQQQQGDGDGDGDGSGDGECSWPGGRCAHAAQTGDGGGLDGSSYDSSATHALAQPSSGNVYGSPARPLAGACAKAAKAVKGAAARYELSALICYFGRHYVAFVRDPRRRRRAAATATASAAGAGSGSGTAGARCSDDEDPAARCPHGAACAAHCGADDADADAGEGEGEGEWVQLNDKAVRPVGQWRELVDLCLLGRYQPTVVCFTKVNSAE